jgi:hypothetical protein
MPKLKSLRFHFFISDSFTLQPNHSITKLEMCHQLAHSQPLVEAIVSLETYDVWNLKLNEAEWIFKNKMKLKLLKLSVGRSGEKICKLYERLKVSGAPINRNIVVVNKYSNS